MLHFGKIKLSGGGKKEWVLSKKTEDIHKKTKNKQNTQHHVNEATEATAKKRFKTKKNLTYNAKGKRMIRGEGETEKQDH